MPKKPTKRKKVAKRKKKKPEPFDVEGVLLENRRVFLFDVVTAESAQRVIKQLYALDLQKQDPIVMYLNTPGGSCSAGLAIIDAIKTIQSPIISVITNQVCSMGAHISIVADRRIAYPSSVWMSHDMASYIEDYSLKIRDRADYLEKYYDILEQNMKDHTKLKAEDLLKARTGELWLFSKEMLKKGIIDEIAGLQ